jgi:hypothetical protein
MPGGGGADKAAFSPFQSVPTPPAPAAIMKMFLILSRFQIIGALCKPKLNTKPKIRELEMKSLWGINTSLFQIYNFVIVFYNRFIFFIPSNNFTQ